MSQDRGEHISSYDRESEPSTEKETPNYRQDKIDI
jgi:hypothetical protein